MPRSGCSVPRLFLSAVIFFFNDPPTTDIYTLSLHDALPISSPSSGSTAAPSRSTQTTSKHGRERAESRPKRMERLRSEEHTSELQSHSDLVCRLLLEKKKKKRNKNTRQRNEQTPRPSPLDVA